jgi:ribA/ribD-fused uncharacterized protein
LAAQLEQQCSLAAAETSTTVAASTLDDENDELISEQGQRIMLIYSQEQRLSNWYFASFVIAGYEFCHVEQFFQWQKAKFFGDNELAEQILQTTNPCRIRRLGSMIRGFSAEIWNQISEKVKNVCVATNKYQHLGSLQCSLREIHAE